MRVKAQTHNFGSYPPDLETGQVRWCRIGDNIGYEENGKNATFTRPVVVLRTFGAYSFFGAPLSRRAKPEKPYYHRILVGDTESWALLSQANSWDASRLMRTIGYIDKNELKLLRRALGRFLGLQ